MRHLMAATTPLRRLHMASNMFSTARKLVLAAPAASSEDQRLRLFRRLYARDFPKAQLEQILRHLQDRQPTHR